jgi:hypothetical protein
MSVETHAKKHCLSFSYSLSFTTRSSHVVPQFLYPRTEMTRCSLSPLINTLNPAPSIVHNPSLLLCHPKSFHIHIPLKRIYIGKVLHSDHAGTIHYLISHHFTVLTEGIHEHGCRPISKPSRYLLISIRTMYIYITMLSIRTMYIYITMFQQHFSK